jgi:hypothetical protein
MIWLALIFYALLRQLSKEPLIYLRRKKGGSDFVDFSSTLSLEAFSLGIRGSFDIFLNIQNCFHPLPPLNVLTSYI